jgi:hypothetical protein
LSAVEWSVIGGLITMAILFSVSSLGTATSDQIDEQINGRHPRPSGHGRCRQQLVQQQFLQRQLLRRQF